MISSGSASERIAASASLVGSLDHAAMSDGEAGGFGGFLTTAKLNIVEFGILCAFWAGVAFVSQFISLAMILGALSFYLPVSPREVKWPLTPRVPRVRRAPAHCRRHLRPGLRLGVHSDDRCCPRRRRLRLRALQVPR